MNKHTPGKWSWYQHDKRDINKPVKVEARTEVIAEIVWKGTDRHEERLANAALIAAAPELAEALRALVGECEDFIRAQGGDNTEAIDKARSALALAGIE